MLDRHPAGVTGAPQEGTSPHLVQGVQKGPSPFEAEGAVAPPRLHLHSPAPPPQEVVVREEGHRRGVPHCGGLDEVVERGVEELSPAPEAATTPLQPRRDVHRGLGAELRIPPDQVGEARPHVQEFQPQLLPVRGPEPPGHGTPDGPPTRGLHHGRESRRGVGPPLLAPGHANAGDQRHRPPPERHLGEGFNGVQIQPTRGDVRGFQRLPSGLHPGVHRDPIPGDPGVHQLHLAPALQLLSARPWRGGASKTPAGQVVEAGHAHRRGEGMRPTAPSGGHGAGPLDIVPELGQLTDPPPLGLLHRQHRGREVQIPPGPPCLGPTVQSGHPGPRAVLQPRHTVHAPVPHLRQQRHRAHRPLPPEGAVQPSP